MLKILYLPLNDLENVQSGMYKGFEELGLNWEIFDFHKDYLINRDMGGVQRRFLEHVTRYQPNLICMQLQMTGIIHPETLVKAKEICPDVIITNFTGDIRTHADQYFINVSQVIDHSLLTNVGQIELYRNAGGKNLAYWQIGISSNQIWPKNSQGPYEYDVVFTGSHYGGQFPDSGLRFNVMTKLKEVFGNRFGLFGSGWSNAQFLNPKQLCEVYSRSLTVLSVSHFNNVSHYFSDRLVGALASGRPTICWDFPGLESYFTNRGDILVAKSVQEIIDWVNYCKENSEFANQVGHNGQLKLFGELSCASRIIELINIAGLGHLL